MMNIVRTVDKLKSLVTGNDAHIKTRTTEVRGRTVQEVVVANGELCLEDTRVLGLTIRFENCKIEGDDWSTFEGCVLYFYDCVIKDVEVSYSMATLKGCTVENMNVYGEEMSLGVGNKIESSILQPRVLKGSGEDVLTFHKEDMNGLGSRVGIQGATAMVVNFGTYSGNVHYFAESDMVIAGCWQGKLDEFKKKASQRGVAKDSYEAVYNYFNSF